MKSFTRFAFALIAAVMVAGCNLIPKEATEHGSVIQTKADGSKIENRSDYAEYAQGKITLASRPLFEMTCPATGCIVMSLKVNAPGQGSDIAPPAAPPKEENAIVGTVRELKEFGLGAAPYLLGHSVVKGFKAMFTVFGDTVADVSGKIQAPQPNNTVNCTGPYVACAQGGAASTIGPVRNTTRTNTYTNSFNPVTNNGSFNPITNPPPPAPTP